MKDDIIIQCICAFHISGAKLIALMDPDKSEYALNILCNWDPAYSGIELQVSAKILIFGTLN